MGEIIDFIFSNDTIAFFCVCAFIVFPSIILWLTEAEGRLLIKGIVVRITPIVSLYLIAIGVWSADGWLERIYGITETLESYEGRGGLLGFILISLWSIILIGWGIVLFRMSRLIKF